MQCNIKARDNVKMENKLPQYNEIIEKIVLLV